MITEESIHGWTSLCQFCEMSMKRIRHLITYHGFPKPLGKYKDHTGTVFVWDTEEVTLYLEKFREGSNVSETSQGSASSKTVRD